MHRGGVVAYPTEAVFGLGCDPDDTAALTRLLALKHRPATHGLILLAASFEQALPFFEDPGAQIMARIQRSWPGPTTWILPAAQVHPLVTGGRNTVAIRVTDHPLCQALCGEFGGAIVSTSANITGHRPARNVLQVRKQFGITLDGIVNGKLGTARQPSQIIDAASNRILRSA